ncbi:uncharacterized protein LOC129124870 [Agelaius phoeniceus]|uniref:uncharacterized protein LOC129124870 n=1 Tax=Agelaius phoeniceus TaxID=39638 RepID=UPI004054BD22
MATPDLRSSNRRAHAADSRESKAAAPSSRPGSTHPTPSAARADGTRARLSPSVSCQVKEVKKPVHTKDLLASKGMLSGAEMRSGKPRQSMLNRKGKKMHTSHSPCSPDKEDKKTRGNCHGEG